MKHVRNWFVISLIGVVICSAFFFFASESEPSHSNAENWNLHEDYDKIGNPLIDIRDLVSAKKQFGESPDIKESFLVELRNFLLRISLDGAEEPEKSKSEKTDTQESSVSSNEESKHGEQNGVGKNDLFARPGESSSGNTGEATTSGVTVSQDTSSSTVSSQPEAQEPEQNGKLNEQGEIVLPVAP